MSTADQPLDGRSLRGDSSSIDEIDARIINALERDGRRPYTTIASELHLSESAVRRRIQRLTSTGTVRVIAVIDPRELGFDVHALVGLNVDGDYEAIAATVAELPEVSRVLVVAGQFDLMVEVVCADHDHLLTVLNRKLRVVPGVASMTTMTVLQTHERTRIATRR